MDHHTVFIALIVSNDRANLKTGGFLAVVACQSQMGAFTVRIDFFAHGMDIAPLYTGRLVILILTRHGAGKTADTAPGINKKCDLFFHSLVLPMPF
jgi:hypothetical protein